MTRPRDCSTMTFRRPAIRQRDERGRFVSLETLLRESIRAETQRRLARVVYPAALPMAWEPSPEQRDQDDDIDYRDAVRDGI